jgi:hypothetical protein
MKASGITIGKLAAGCALACCLASNIHAQTAGAGSFNNGLAPGQSAAPDSIVQLTADAQGLAQMAPADLPRTGTYWLVLPGGFPAPAPCPPLDPGVPVYQMASGQFLVDETGGAVAVEPRRFGMQAQSRSSAGASALEAQANAVVSLITRVQTAAANQQMQAMGLEVPLAGGDGANGFSSDSFNYTHPTNGLWLEMNGITNQQVYITAHNVIDGYFQLLFKTNLSDNGWTVDTDDDEVIDAADVFPLWSFGPPPAELDPGATNCQMFFWARQSDTEVGIEGGGAVLRPSPGIAPGPAFFSVNRYFWPDDDPSINSNLVVHFSLSGTASNGVDYVLRDYNTGQTLTNSITILAPNTFATIELDPATNLLCLANLTATVTLEDGTNYVVNSQKAAITSTIDFNDFCLIATADTVPGPCGMDYHPPTHSLIVSSENSSGVWSFKRIDTNGVVTNWSGLQITGPDEVKLATVKATVNGFTNGAMFFDSSGSGAIGRLSPDGTDSTLNFFATSGGEQFWGLYIDQSGCFDDNLVALLGGGSIWQINASGAAVASYPGANVGDGEGVVTVDSDTNQYNPLAGKIFTGTSTVNTNGIVVPLGLNLVPEDCDIIQSNQNLYCADNLDGEGGRVLEVPKELFAGHVGDVLVTQNGVERIPASLTIVHWDATNGLVTTQIPMPNYVNYFEHVTFAPMDIPAVSPPVSP